MYKAALAVVELCVSVVVVNKLTWNFSDRVWFWSLVAVLFAFGAKFAWDDIVRPYLQGSQPRLEDSRG